MKRLYGLSIVASLLGGGCATTVKPAPPPTVLKPNRPATAHRLPPAVADIRLVADTQSAAPPSTGPVLRAVPVTRANHPEELPTIVGNNASPNNVLEVEQLTADVVARNPSMQAMFAAWQSAAQRYPQVVALDDPMLDVNVGPGSWGRSDVESAYMVMASQKFDWPGKRPLRGAVANAATMEAETQIEAMRLQLAEMAKLAFYDYYAAYQQRSLNDKNLKETREYRDSAAAKLRASLVTQQDVLQAEVELALLEQRRNELDRQVRVAAARINTLLHQDAASALPPPPATLSEPAAMPSIAELRTVALQFRPDLAAKVAQIRSAEATINLAQRDYYPDVALYAKYDAFWQEQPLRTAVGVNVNVPINKSRRSAQVREASLRLRQFRAEYDRLVDEVTNELHSNFERMEESRRTSLLFVDRIIPAAQQNVESARAGYTAGKVDFLRLIEAQRQLIALREQQVEIESNYYRRRAELERAAAVPVVEIPTVGAARSP